MTKRIETPAISEILNEEFMKPLGLSAYRLARDIHVPVSRIQDLLHGRRKMTADTSIRLAKYFGVSDSYFIHLQNDIDIRNLKIEIAEELDSIRPYAENPSPGKEDPAAAL
ncbi:MAG: HigA family addiction module antitoxin [Erysipelotrichaceae bacterium]|jgi:addiction module HigA family antidote|nr:HigA family addiction module antitoxin [Erysipelotrichaceae bacterium]